MNHVKHANKSNDLRRRSAASARCLLRDALAGRDYIGLAGTTRGGRCGAHAGCDMFQLDE